MYIRDGKLLFFANTLTLYPNLASHYVIVSGLNTHDGFPDLQIYDLAGRLIRSQEWTSLDSEKIHIPAFSNGVYQVRAESGSEFDCTVKKENQIVFFVSRCFTKNGFY